MENKVIAVFDIGKTNKKILLFNQEFKVVYQFEEKFATTVDEEGFECDDIQLIQDWMVDALKTIDAKGEFDIQGINFSTYGASLAFLDKNGKLLTPIYNYLKEVDPKIQEALFDKHGGVNEFCRRTASPALGLLLNSGIQTLWLKENKAEIWAQVDQTLHFPQYLSYVLTGKVCSEPTSIGCHTFMWDFDNMKYHPWVQEEGVNLPEPLNNDVVFPADINGKKIQTGVGIHDSSASLVPYLANSKEEFILVSTGTWCISMNPFNDEPLTADQLKNDCLCFLTPEKKQVKSSRLFMGHFHEVLVAKLNEYFKMDANYYKGIPFEKDVIEEILQKYGEEMAFFPKGIEMFDAGLEQIDLSVYESFDQAYTRMVMELTKLCINSIKLIIPKNDTTKTIYISGGFSRNPIFVELLSDFFSGKRVFTSEIDNASALGAALVIAPQLKGFNTNAVELVSLENSITK